MSVCKKDWFDCKSAGCYNPWCDGTCLPLRRVNNGMNDCADGSDEGILGIKIEILFYLRI